MKRKQRRMRPLGTGGRRKSLIKADRDSRPFRFPSCACHCLRIWIESDDLDRRVTLLEQRRKCPCSTADIKCMVSRPKWCLLEQCATGLISAQQLCYQVI